MCCRRCGKRKPRDDTVAPQPGSPLPLSEYCTAEAARCSQFSTLRWLRALQPPCPFNERCTQAAAYQQDLSMLQWLRAGKCPWNADCTLAAAKTGNLRMLQWMLAEDPPCPLHDRIAEAAARCGHVAMLRLLKDQGCYLSSHLYYCAALDRHLHALQWLHYQGVPVPQALPSMHNPGVWYHLQSPTILMFLADARVPLPVSMRSSLNLARRTCCIFHGLLRWCRSTLRDPSRAGNQPFSRICAAGSGQQLLLGLSMLPAELINKVAVMAELQPGPI